MRYDNHGALLATEVPGARLAHRGKVRDVYDLGEHLLFVATDRISAFDVVLPNGIPDKGKVLTALSLFWFKHLSWMPNHLVTAEASEFPASIASSARELAGRSMLVRKAAIHPVECIVRAYLVGSGWKDYQKTGCVCGIPLRPGYRQADKLDTPLFTPSTKAEQGAHDENISFDAVVALIGKEQAEELRSVSLRLYSEAARHAESRGVLLADTKFEFGRVAGRLVLADEVLTPDSSRYWPAASYAPGANPPSLDKQFVRDYLETLDWDKTAPGPALPADIVFKMREKYIECLRNITGAGLPA